MKQKKTGIAWLTPREREVMQHVITGLPNKAVAAQMGITERTVKAHRGQVMAKMGARSFAELVRKGFKFKRPPMSEYNGQQKPIMLSADLVDELKRRAESLRLSEGEYIRALLKADLEKH